MENPISLYCRNDPVSVETMDLCRGEDDYRKVYIVDDGVKKIVIKQLSNTFSDRKRIEGWFRLMEEYRKIGVYCPAVVPNLSGELIHCETADGRTFYTYAEEFAVYRTAEQIGEENYEDERGRESYIPDVLRSLGTIASAHLDFLDWPSAYCLLEPFCAPDTTDETTECAELFVRYVREHLPDFRDRAENLLKLFYDRQAEVRGIYGTLPTSCFQADLGDNNVLLEENCRFAGLIDFNLCGREPVLNYAVRAALWHAGEHCLYDEKDRPLYFYSRQLDDMRTRSFLENMEYIQETYSFGEAEREAFPVLFRYINSFWWEHLNEIEAVREDRLKTSQLFDWLEYQMTRDDIRLTEITRREGVPL